MGPDGQKKLALITFGCQMNKHDSEWIAGLLDDQYQLIDDHKHADLVIINTCAVRDKAEQKFFSLLGRLKPLKNKTESLIIGIAGCVSQELGANLLKRNPIIDFIVGPRAINTIPNMLDNLARTGEPQINISDSNIFEEYPMNRDSKYSAWVSIMQGCDNHCAYCIVPYTRGLERSRKPDSILKEIEGLANNGYKEITLLGQNVNSYGAKESDGIDFPQLLRAVNEVDGIDRIRFMTSHPKDLNDRLIQTLAEFEKICPSVHLPLQSGSSRILKAMSRGYTFEEYSSKINRLREAVPDLALTTDIIVGYPGEKELDFNQTLAAISQIEYESIFLFKYSPRKGTPASIMTDEVPFNVISDRFLRLEKIQRVISKKKYDNWVGRQTEIIVEGPSKKDPKKQSGRNPQNLMVHIDSDIDYTGTTLRVSITGSNMYSLKAEVV
ncbi:MAG TPA: tRNA (N6-isopentenyl adenosine(37)-C2)-methylthiotransferase MiaB [Nitrospinota bacterium]|nr:tRNA (N6-isopentenyl adenosine(37)-C2)-methylthiotransferase MiaB [Nitrospinota bacterium]|tara:strand:+ start:46869 stop:48185 length:1317 start_codon:yes stop_codon:yes gene_type:complete